MSSSYEANNQVETIYTTRIQKGIFAAIATLISPTIVPLTYFLSQGFNPSESTVTILLIAAITVVAIMWASSIVTCIWDMIRYGSHTSAAGLFLLLLAPLFWAIIAGFLLSALIAESLAEFAGNFTPTL